MNKVNNKLNIIALSIITLSSIFITANAKDKPTRVIRIISVQGGALRGLIPLAGIDYLTKTTKKSVNQLFDVAAGSSTGSIIVSALTNGTYEKQPVTTTTLIDLYLMYGSKIFSNTNTGSNSETQNNVAATQTASANALYEIISTLLQNTTLRQAKSNLIIPAYSMTEQQPYVFNSWAANHNANYYLKDLVMASTSNPGYFPQYNLKTTAGKSAGYFIDPGVSFTNQPALIAYTLAQKQCPNCKFIIAAFNTGAAPGYTAAQITASRNWSSQQWTDNLSYKNNNSISSRAISVSDNDILDTMANTKDSNIIYYHDFNIPLTKQESAGGYSGDKNTMQAYLQKGTEMVTQNKRELNKLGKLLLKYQNQN
jgi:patatin-like phospholipase/acyl hydrolase